MDPDLQQYLWAGAASASWLALCVGIYIREKRSKAPVVPDTASGPPVLILWASQTGFAEDLAQRTGQSLRKAGVPVRILPLATTTDEQIVGASAALFIVSTTGEGDPPDGAELFLRRDLPSLKGLRYALLALGDRSYSHFCGFGHQLDRALHAAGAVPINDLIEVDNGDMGALRHWQQLLPLVGGATEAPDWSPPEYVGWRLADRRLLNEGSAGHPVHHIRLEPEGDLPEWLSGAIAEIYPGAADALLDGAAEAELPHREYSIASLPDDAGVELIIRRHIRDDGVLGLGSGWLCEQAPVGSRIAMRLRANSSFAPPDEPVPMILIGNGTGIAGLRAHLKARAPDTRNWLIFGERNRAHDRLLGGEIADWVANGHLERCDLVFSRDGIGPRYVSGRIDEVAEHLTGWVAAGAVIYVCGSLNGMAGDVDTTLARILGRDALDDLVEQGRYRRDVY